MNNFKFYTIENDLYYNGEIILKYSIEYPEVILSKKEKEKEDFNYANRKQAMDLKEFVENELYEHAKCTYDFNKKQNYPVTVFNLIFNTNINYERK